MANRKDFEKKIEEIKEVVGNKSLFIGRIPDKTKAFFITLAKDAFDDDYGFTLKMLCDVYQGLYPSNTAEQDAKIDLLAEEIQQIKKKLEEPSKKRIKTVSGREIGG